MAQSAKPIDLRRTFLPLDPEAFPETMHGTLGEDTPEKSVPVMAYEGWNFMPTAEGYRSYFGLGITLDVDALDTRCDEILIMQLSNYSNIAIALCDDGFYIKDAGSSGAWTRYAATNISDNDTYYLVTWCIIENVLYIYRQGEAEVWTIDRAGTVDSFAPAGSVINMSGQVGIFKAGGRLGFWDTDNAFSWSAFLDKTDLLPAISTQANVGVTFSKLIGAVVTVKQSGNGFLIYATKSIVYVFQDLTNTYLWKDNLLSGTAGIAYPKQALYANPDSINFAWTTVGLMKISDGQIEIIAAEIYDYLRESAKPVTLFFMEGRFLFLNILDEKFIEGAITSFTNTNVTTSSNLCAVLQQLSGDIAISDSALSAAFTKLGNITADSLMLGLNCLTAFENTAIETTEEPGEIVFTYEGIPDELLSSITVGDTTTYTIDFNNIAFIDDPDGWYDPTITLYEIIISPTEITVHTIIEAVETTDAPITIAHSLVASDGGFTMILGSSASTPVTGYTTPTYTSYFGRITQFNEAGAFDSERPDTVATPQASDFDDGASNNITITRPGTLGLLNYHLISDYRVGDLNVVGTPTEHTNSASVNADVVAKRQVIAGEWVSPFDNITDFFVNAEIFWAQDLEWAQDRINTYIRYLHRKIDEADIAQADSTVVGVHTISGALYGVTEGWQDPTDIFTVVLPVNFTPAEWLKDGRGVIRMQKSVLSARKYAFKKKQRISPIVDHSGLTAEASPGGFIFGHYASLVAAKNAFMAIWNPTFDAGDYELFATGNTFSYTGAPDAVNAHSAGFTLRKISTGGTVFPDGFHLAYDDLIHYRQDIYVEESTVLLNPCDATFVAALIPETIYNRIANVLTEKENAPMVSDGDIQNSCEVSNTAGYFGGVPHDTAVADFVHSPGYSFTPASHTREYSASSFWWRESSSVTVNLVAGSPFPIYPTYEGSLVYDTFYQKWGKMKNQFTALLDLAPVNKETSPIAPAIRYGVLGALLGEDGLISIFDHSPEDSYIKYGKIGMFRLGETVLEEVRAQFRLLSTGSIETETSLDGKSVEVTLTTTEDFANEKVVRVTPAASGSWHNITVRGQYDLVYLEFRAYRQGRR